MKLSLALAGTSLSVPQLNPAILSLGHLWEIMPPMLAPSRSTRELLSMSSPLTNVGWEPMSHFPLPSPSDSSQTHLLNLLQRSLSNTHQLTTAIINWKSHRCFRFPPSLFHYPRTKLALALLLGKPG